MKKVLKVVLLFVAIFISNASAVSRIVVARDGGGGSVEYLGFDGSLLLTGDTDVLSGSFAGMASTNEGGLVALLNDGVATSKAIKLSSSLDEIISGSITGVSNGILTKPNGNFVYHRVPSGANYDNLHTLYNDLSGIQYSSADIGIAHSSFSMAMLPSGGVMYSRQQGLVRLDSDMLNASGWDLGGVINKIAVMPNGKLVLVRSFATGAYGQFQLVTFNSDFTGFSESGLRDGTVKAMTVLSNGNIVVGRDINGANELLLYNGGTLSGISDHSISGSIIDLDTMGDGFVMMRNVGGTNPNQLVLLNSSVVGITESGGFGSTAYDVTVLPPHRDARLIVPQLSDGEIRLLGYYGNGWLNGGVCDFTDDWYWQAGCISMAGNEFIAAQYNSSNNKSKLTRYNSRFEVLGSSTHFDEQVSAVAVLADGSYAVVRKLNNSSPIQVVHRNIDLSDSTKATPDLSGVDFKDIQPIDNGGFILARYEGGNKSSIVLYDVNFTRLDTYDFDNGGVIEDIVDANIDGLVLARQIDYATFGLVQFSDDLSGINGSGDMSGTFHAMTVANNDDIIIARRIGEQEQLKVIRINGGTFTEVCSDINIFGLEVISLRTLNGGNIAMLRKVGEDLNQLVILEYDGTDGSLTGIKETVIPLEIYDIFEFNESEFTDCVELIRYGMGIGADFDNDCKVGFEDLEFMVYEWLYETAQ